MRQAVTTRTSPRTLRARIVRRVELRTGSFLASLETEAQRCLMPLLRRLPFGSRREVQRLAQRLDRLEHRLRSSRDASVVRTLTSASLPTERYVTVPLLDEIRIEQALLHHLTDDEQRALRARFELTDAAREVSTIGASEGRVVRRALTKLWLSSCQADG